MKIFILGRDQQKSRTLAEEFGAQEISDPSPMDVVISCVPGEAEIDFSKIQMTSETLAIDMAYFPKSSKLLSFARGPTVTGEEILVLQGLLQSRLWLGEEPKLTKPDLLQVITHGA